LRRDPKDVLYYNTGTALGFILIAAGTTIGFLTTNVFKIENNTLETIHLVLLTCGLVCLAFGWLVYRNRMKKFNQGHPPTTGENP